MFRPGNAQSFRLGVIGNRRTASSKEDEGGNFGLACRARILPLSLGGNLCRCLLEGLEPNTFCNDVTISASTPNAKNDDATVHEYRVATLLTQPLRGFNPTSGFCLFSRGRFGGRDGEEVFFTTVFVVFVGVVDPKAFLVNATPGGTPGGIAITGGVSGVGGGAIIGELSVENRFWFEFVEFVENRFWFEFVEFVLSADSKDSLRLEDRFAAILVTSEI